jgi:hypothetical protein
MSKWAQKRKRRLATIIGVLFLALLVLILFSIFNRPATCFDGEQNGAETGVDCGGACQLVCREEVRDIVVWWERPFKVANGVYNTVAYFENQNLESGLQELTYEFRLYNYDNILVSEPIVGTTFVEPNKRSAVFESGITTGDQDAYTAFFRVSSVQDWERTDQDFAYSLFEIGEPELTNQDIAPKLQAPIKNTSFKTYRDVPVIAILYNQEDNAIAASQTFLDVIEQGGEGIVYYSWPEPFGDTVSRIEIIPRVDPFREELE